MKKVLLLFMFLPSLLFAQNEAYIIVHEQTGKILLEKNATDPKYPASLTKLMTLYITFDALSQNIYTPNSQLTISQKASEQVPSKLGLVAGEKISVRDAVLGVIIKSANDASVVLSENLSGSEQKFSDIMTKTAKQIGLSKTNFENASGLGDDNQYSNAKDLALLGMAIYLHFPQYYDLFSKESFVYKETQYTTHNHLLKNYEGTDGLKTGYIKKSGYNIVASVERQGVRLFGVYLGGNTITERDEKMKNLFNEAFKKFFNIEKRYQKDRLFYLQLGAFSQKANALKKQESYTGSKIENKKDLYLVKIENLSYDEAQRQCEKIKAKKEECLIQSVK
ncbi:MAG: D-alanyl-D-alanine carboxypeptidase [Alphaproteobacteria bacterium]|nr:D-alanyl-D-alanine carboxypeptidase [Alphaproteobacteria bacterium]